MRKIVIVIIILLNKFAFTQSLAIQLKNSNTGFGMPGSIIVKSNLQERIIKTDKRGFATIKSLKTSDSLIFRSNNTNTQRSIYNFDSAKAINLVVSLDPKNSNPKQDLANNEVIGFISCAKTNKPIRGANVKLLGMLDSSFTDKRGFFKLTVPEDLLVEDTLGVDLRKLDRRVNLTVKRKRYKNLVMVNLRIFSGGTILKLSLDPGNGELEKISRHKILDRIIERDPPLYDSMSYTTKHPEVIRGLIPTTIRVAHGAGNTPCAACRKCDVIEQMSLEQYCKSGLDDEWIASWNKQALMAGAVAYRSYAAYHTLHPYGSGYDIVAFPCRQNWDGTTISKATSNAVEATENQVLVNGVGAIVMAEYAAETNNFCTKGDGYSGQTGFWPCIQDEVCQGKPSSGHGRGMCQWGSQRWANKAVSVPQPIYDYKWILNHYYGPQGYFLLNQ